MHLIIATLVALAVLVSAPVAATDGGAVAETKARDEARRAWQRGLVEALQRHKRYPARLRDEAKAEGRSGPAGQVLLAFAIDRKGELVSLAVETSSGIAEFDEAALEMVRRAAPFPPPPDATEEIENFKLPVVFN